MSETADFIFKFLFPLGSTMQYNVEVLIIRGNYITVTYIDPRGTYKIYIPCSMRVMILTLIVFFRDTGRRLESYSLDFVIRPFKMSPFYQQTKFTI